MPADVGMLMPAFGPDCVLPDEKARNTVVVKELALEPTPDSLQPSGSRAHVAGIARLTLWVQGALPLIAANYEVYTFAGSRLSPGNPLAKWTLLDVKLHRFYTY
jgi:hypothetical protein